MQQPDLEVCVVRVCDGQGQTRGTGFVVTGGLVVTCAHVLKACRVASGGCVRVEFHVGGEARQAEALPDSWRSPEADDVAILQLLPPGKALPDGVIPVVLGSAHHCHGHGMCALGFPSLTDGYDVAWAKGKIRGEVPHPAKQPMLQLDALPILPGMSGAPVLDLDTGRVVGMVSEYLKHAPLEWATTSDTLATICPDLQLHVPQAVEEYLAAVAQFCRDLPYVSLRGDVLLEAVYVRQQMRPQPDDAHDEEEARRLLKEHAQPMSIVEALERHPRIVVVGGAGAGKSTLLRHLVQQNAIAALDVNVQAERAKPPGLKHSPKRALLSQYEDLASCPYIPVLVSLRGLAEREGDLATCLREQIAAELGARLSQSLPDNFLAGWAEQTGTTWLIALDGLDEIVDTGRRRELLRELAQAAWPAQARVLVTTRPDAATTLPQGFTLFDLLPFERGQVAKFARRWFRDDEQRTQAFLDALESARLGELSGTPLLLTVAATVFEEALKKPGFSGKPGFFAGFRRSRLYDEFVRILLDEDAAPGRRMREQFREQFGADLGEALFRHRRQILERIAQAIQEQVDMHAALAERLRQLPFNRSDLDVDQNASDVLEILACQRAGLVTRRGDAYAFIHPTFREYLAAASMIRESEQDLEQLWKRAISRWPDKNWREVALFTIGMLSDAGRDVTALMKRIPWEDDEEGLAFVGTALAEQAKMETGLSNSVIDILIGVARGMTLRYMLHTPNHPLIILSRLQDYPRAARGLLALACDPAAWDWVRVQAAEALGRMGRVREAVSVLLAIARMDTMGERDRAVEALGTLGRADDLIRLARDEQVDPAMRWRSAQVLGKLGLADPLRILACDDEADTGVRLEAAGALGKLGQADGLLVLVRDNKVRDEVRWQAAYTLENLGLTHEAAQAWLVLACDKQVKVWARRYAAKVLGELGQAGGLLALVRDKEAEAMARIRSAEMLCRPGWEDELIVLAHDEQVEAWFHMEAAAALGKLGRTDESIPILSALAHDEQTEAIVRVMAAVALGQLGWTNEAIPILLTQAHSENVVICLIAATALGRLGQADEAVPILSVLMHDPHELVRARAAAALGQLGQTDEAFPALLTLARGESVEAWIRLEAAVTLGGLGRIDEAAPILLTLVCSESVEVQTRVEAAEALDQLGRSDEAARAWLALARDQEVEWYVWEQAVEALGRLRRANDLLILARDEKVHDWTRVKIAKVLGELGCSDLLLVLSRDEKVHNWTRMKAVETLGELGCADYLLDLACDEKVDIHVRLKTARVLSQLRYTDEATRAWLALAHNTETHVGGIIEALGELRQPGEAVQTWLVLVRDAQVNFEVRQEAAAALGKFADARVVPELERIAQMDEHEYIRQPIQSAIRKICRRWGMQQSDRSTLSFRLRRRGRRHRRQV